MSCTHAARPATLLVPGYSDTARVLRHCRRFLLDAGWPESHVLALGFRNRYGSNLEHAAELGAAAEELRSRAGVARVAVVAHSMGGLALRHFLAIGGAEVIETAIFVGTPHHGTYMAWLVPGQAAREMRPGSEFLRRLAAQPIPDHVRTACIRTPLDTRVVPGSSAFLDGAECHVVRRPGHPRMLRHRGTLRLIARLLAGQPADAG
jgi:triacylglycerol lipase